jgi:hypothetical protein
MTFVLQLSISLSSATILQQHQRMEFTLFYGFCPVSDVLDSAQVLTQKLLS